MLIKVWDNPSLQVHKQKLIWEYMEDTEMMKQVVLMAGCALEEPHVTLGSGIWRGDLTQPKLLPVVRSVFIGCFNKQSFNKTHHYFSVWGFKDPAP